MSICFPYDIPLYPLPSLLLPSNQAEGEVGGLSRRISLLEVDYEQTAVRLSTASEKLEEASKVAEEAERYEEIVLESIMWLKNKN